ncbi:unnamed protein product [Triticum turgidum subsp. durum]|uniref:AB hydrolase-1 domain-containing protein n=1 Tax=Triticum turgidum subsp. durum TaxID=4567 RepID=A0A9R0RD14_TRITD|nr:unnamed protein product [Triticum turgidum subsp. durum]
MGFGVVSLLNAVFRRAFTSAGLRPSSVAVDADTTLHFWAHPSLLSSKGPEDDRALAAKGGVADVTELMVPADTKALRRLMDICAHGPPKYLPECLARDLLRKCFAVQREGKIELIKGIASGHGFQITPLPQEVLIVWGEFDQIFPVAKAHKVKEKLGEKATVRIIPDTGHLPQQEDSKLFNQILLDFLLPPPSSSNGAAAAK